MLIYAGEPCIVCCKVLVKQQRLYIGRSNYVAVCCQETGSAPKQNIKDRFTPKSAWAKAAGEATYDRVSDAVVDKAAEKGTGLTPAELKAELARAAGAGAGAAK